MKSFFPLYRSLLMALFVAASLTACKKDNEPAPDVATRVAGTYTFSELTYGGRTVPASQTNLKGNVTVTRQTASTISMALDITSKSDDEPFLVGSVDDIAVTDAGNGDVEFKADSDKIARASGNKLIINGTDDNDVDFTITATK
ncbi:hypothetical protein ACFSUS_15540 [Spirosoma soli]|uniref:Lipocalin-like domain-containing protein n=1 Tax=Spirosoma soli TaxID=1770529 RepID=A0ABW5M662_9BACT